MCARNYWCEAIKLRDMSIELFNHKILPFLRTRQNVTLQGFGEPLLNKYFFEMLSECKRKGVRVTFTTNGTLLKENARRLVELQTDEIVVSIDGIKSFKEIRGIEIDSIIDGIEELKLMKVKLNKNYPIIKIEFVAMKRNISELLELIDLAYSLEIKDIYVVHIIVHTKQLIEQSLFTDIEKASKYFMVAKSKAQELGINLSLPHLEGVIKVCMQPFEVMLINWNGDVRACCGPTINKEEESALKLGNLTEFSLQNLWNSAHVRKLRMALLGKGVLPSVCKECPLRIYSLKSHIKII